MSARRARARCPTPSKQSYPDPESADAELARIRSSMDLNLLPPGLRIPSRVYHCPCGRWHLTSRPHAGHGAYDRSR